MLRSSIRNLLFILCFCFLTVPIIDSSLAQDIKSSSKIGENIFPILTTNTDGMKLKIERVETAQVRKHKLEGDYLAVHLSLTANTANKNIELNKNNTKIVYRDNKEVNEWIAWFPKRKQETKDISVFEGEMVSIQIAVADKTIGDAYGRSSTIGLGYGSMLRVGGEMDLIYNMAYHNGDKGILKMNFSMENASHEILLLFPSKKSPKDLKIIKIGNFHSVDVTQRSGNAHHILNEVKQTRNTGINLKPEQSRKTSERSILPQFEAPLIGTNEVRIKNPNDFEVTVALRSSKKGKDFTVSSNGVASVVVPNGKYEIYFVYSNKPDALFRGDDFSLNDNGVEIQIVKVVGGNYGIKQVK